MRVELLKTTLPKLTNIPLILIAMLELTDNMEVGEMPVTPDSLPSRFSAGEHPVYKDFVSFFVSGVVGVRHFDRNKTTNIYSTYVTISDEAFAVLTLENNWERWSAMATADEWKESDIPTKWTTSRDKRTSLKKSDNDTKQESDEDDQTPQATRYRGWSWHGIERYNQLFNEIKASRSTPSFQKFELYLISEYKREEEDEGKHRGKRQKIDTRKPLPEAQHELWDVIPHSNTNIRPDENVVFPSELGQLGEQAGV